MGNLREPQQEKAVILQGLGVSPGSATEHWPSRKIVRKWPFFLGGKKITQKKYIFFAYIF